MYLKIQKLVKIIIIKRRVKVPLLIVFQENNKDTRVFKTSSVFILFYVISLCIMWKIFYMTLSIRVWQYCLCTRWYTATDWLWSNPPTALVFENDSELNPHTHTQTDWRGSSSVHVHVTHTRQTTQSNICGQRKLKVPGLLQGTLSSQYSLAV